MATTLLFDTPHETKKDGTVIRSINWNTCSSESSYERRNLSDQQEDNTQPKLQNQRSFCITEPTNGYKYHLHCEKCANKGVKVTRAVGTIIGKPERRSVIDPRVIVTSFTI